MTSDSVATQLNGHAQRGFRCVVDSVFSLPNADGARWVAVTYSLFHPDSAPQTRHQPDAVGAALFARAAREARWRMEWTLAEHTNMIWRVLPELARRPEGTALLGVTFCLNGTGGCWQEFLSRRNGRWREVEEAWRAQLPDLRDGRMGKGAGVALETLTGSYGFYAPDDPNCCPSRELRVILDFRRDSLVLVRHLVRPWPR